MPPTVLITGGARRIGAVLSRAFGKRGWHVVIHYRSSADEPEALADELPSAECVQCDLADWAASVAMVRDVADRHQDWRVLVNCAAIFLPDSVHALDPGIFSDSMRINAETPTQMGQTFMNVAQAEGGKRLIEFLDQKLLNPNPDFFSYTMAKHAFASTVRMMAMASNNPEDRVYGLAPGAMLPSYDQMPDEHQKSGRMNLLERLTEPSELADAALFLAEGWLASGETLYVDSGQHMLSQPRDVLYLARA
ncbi:MAG: SDR family oxidoreductase [Novosphingobium sp.]|nr:SDR family oxidoreductase [Novosphingobium sp.]